MSRRKAVRTGLDLSRGEITGLRAAKEPPPPPGPPARKKGPDRCTGHCCRSFLLRLSPAELAQLRTDPHASDDERLIASMVIPLGKFHSNPTQLIKGESWAEKALNLGLKSDEHIKSLEEQMGSGDRWLSMSRLGDHYYACRYVLLNGDCSIYENRPQMCRSYPNGHECAFEECTAPKQPREQLIDVRHLHKKRI